MKMKNAERANHARLHGLLAQKYLLRLNMRMCYYHLRKFVATKMGRDINIVMPVKRGTQGEQKQKSQT